MSENLATKTHNPFNNPLATVTSPLITRHKRTENKAEVRVPEIVIVLVNPWKNNTLKLTF